MRFEGLDAREARAFAEKWLPAWTGNDPERLVSFYTDDGQYSDPAIPVGARVIEAAGVCSVQLRKGRIYANRVFFDRSALLEAIQAARRA